MRESELDALKTELESLQKVLSEKVERMEELERKHEEMISENRRHLEKLRQLESQLVSRLDGLDGRLRYLESPEESLPPDERMDYRKV